MRTFAVLFLVLVGCGSGMPSDPLAGTAWSTTIQNTSCATGFGFNADSTYEHLTICTLNDGTTAAEIDEGDYSADARTLSLVLRQASCLASDYTSLTPSMGYSVSADIMTISSSTGALVLSRSQGSGGMGGTGAVTYGCFDASGNFTVEPIAPL